MKELIKGRVSEDFFLRSMELFAEDRTEHPPWIRNVRRATKEQDKRGIDFVVETDIGEIYVQIKSSIGGAKKYIENHIDAPFEICIIVTSDTDTHVSVFRRARSLIAKRRQQMLGGPQEKVLLSTPYSPKAAA